MPRIGLWFRNLAAVVTVCCPASGTTAAQELIYELGVTGPESSYAEECLGSGACYRYPVFGRIGITLSDSQPSIRKIDSIIEYAGIPAPLLPLSDFTWNHFELMVGRYTIGPPSADPIMQFEQDPRIDASGPLISLQVALTGNKSLLTLSGKDAFQPVTERDVERVRLYMIGRLIPEPSGLLLLATAITCLIASRRNR